MLIIEEIFYVVRQAGNAKNIVRYPNRNCSAHKENILFYSILRTPKTAMKREL